MKNELLPPKRRLQIIGEINDEGYKEFSEALYKLEYESKNPVTVELNSFGGDVTAALAYAARIRVCTAPVYVIAYGQVYSAAVLILASGHKRIMTKECWAMVHEEFAKIKGEVKELEKEIKHLRRLEIQWNDMLQVLTKLDSKKWEALHKATTYMDAKECLAAGLVDIII